VAKFKPKVEDKSFVDDLRKAVTFVKGIQEEVGEVANSAAKTYKDAKDEEEKKKKEAEEKAAKEAELAA